MSGPLPACMFGLGKAVTPEVGWQLPAAVVGALLAASIIIYIIIRILTHRHEDLGPEAGNLPGRPPKKG